MVTQLTSNSTAGKLRADGLRFGVIASRYNNSITESLERAALEALKSAGSSEKQVDVLSVPGAFELPLAAKKLAEAGRVNAIIAIGCVLRGETSHYDYICSEVARGIQLAQMDTGVPVIFCVLTCDTMEQAMERAGTGPGNKGHEAGLAALEMASLVRKLRGDVPSAPKAVPKTKTRAKTRKARR
jgi:6,7-dimethyl-8-ribityllumazine synthase